MHLWLSSALLERVRLVHGVK